MSLPESTISTADAATQTLWRAAETGDVDELVSVLPRVTDINARNEHGVTALMRAAQHGRLPVVLVLLDHGADANITRNDKFSALALAAFFGHTEVVRALMEHGADSQASTRNATSPHMWATARTFKNVVDELKHPANPTERAGESEKVAALVQQSAPATLKLVDPVSRAVARAAAGSTVVRKLKDPPEIWDLVHPAPKGFDARSAFVARLSSIRRGFAFRAAMVVVLASVCAVGVWVLRGVQARGEGRAPSAAASNVVSPNVTTPNAETLTVATPSAPVDSAATTSAAISPSTSVEASSTFDVATNRPTFTPKRSPRIKAAHSSEQPSIVATNDVSQPVAEPPKPNPQPRSEQPPTSKNTTPLSSQLLTPAKNATPKAKVIQWP